MVSAWAVEHRLVLAQLATEEHSNDLTAIALLFKQRVLKGGMVTIDALGTQTPGTGVSKREMLPWYSKTPCMTG